VWRFIVLIAATAFGANAEGGRQEFSCVRAQICDATGTCHTADGSIDFVVAPVAIDNNGAGDFEISYAGKHHAMQKPTGFGPMVWTGDTGDIQTLLISTPTEFVWHHLLPGDPTNSGVEFLKCKVTL